ncbi:transcription initiation factor TFIID subunit 8 [Striga asiatica]|uniref:Transcription initiation factor TFIID subunit 8 n=1 Tax=Striga asiatica TaxID=4170 RepID=A0A5A7PFI0_STRAF|nr:transcription initiation factor TFIID subunit 8 [Striga asiatica]
MGTRFFISMVSLFYDLAVKTVELHTRRVVLDLRWSCNSATICSNMGSLMARGMGSSDRLSRLITFVSGDKLKSLSERENQQSKRRKKKSGADEFVEAIARIAVAQVCESLGFQSFQQSALDSLTDVGVRYIREIGKTASFNANLANRSECNVFDVIQGLEDLGLAQGFSGASDVNHSLSGSGVIKDIISYVGQADEIPSAYLNPIFPVVKERILNPSYPQAGVNPPNHIPTWLPNFPAPQTYSSLSSGNEKDLETAAVDEIQPVERPMFKFQHKLVSNGLKSCVVDDGDASKSQRAEESNPFLAPPWPHGEKEISLPVLPSKFLDDIADYRKNSEAFEKNLTSSEPTAKPHASMRSGSCEPENSTEILLNRRLELQFKFGNIKKPLRMMTDPQNESTRKLSVWFGDDCEETA